MQGALDRAVDESGADRASPTAAFTGEGASGEEAVSVIAVTSREVIRARRIESGRSRRREMTVEPDGIDADELGVEATAGCTATRAIRTAHSRPLFVCGERPARRAFGHPNKGAGCVWIRAMGRERIGAHQAGDLGARAHARARRWSVGDVRGACGERRVGPESRLGATASPCAATRARRPPCGVLARRAERGVSPARAAQARRLAVKLNRTDHGAAPMSRIVHGEDNPTVPVLSQVMDAVEAIALAIERRGTVQVVSAWVE